MSQYVQNPPVEENTDPRYTLGEATVTGMNIPKWAVGLGALSLLWVGTRSKKKK